MDSRGLLECKSCLHLSKPRRPLQSQSCGESANTQHRACRKSPQCDVGHVIAGAMGSLTLDVKSKKAAEQDILGISKPNL